MEWIFCQRGGEDANYNCNEGKNIVMEIRLSSIV